MARCIFVTGGNGFIGQSLVKQWIASPNLAIKVLSRRPAAEGLSSPARPLQVVGDLLNAESYQASMAGCDTVVHLAALTGRAAPEDYERVNLEGTRTLLRACKAAGVRRFVHVSTIAAGYADQKHYPYAKSKALAEAEVAESGLDFAIVRPTLVLGRSSPIWNTLVKIAKLPIVPLPEGSQSVLVQPVHVDDVARGIALLTGSDRFNGEVLELGGPRPMSWREFIGLIREASGDAPPRIVGVPLAPIRALLAAIEPIARPMMPVTAGQLAVFANDSVPSHNWLQARLLPHMPDTETTVADLVDAGDSDADRMGSGQKPQRRHAQEMPEKVEQVLREECRLFTSYLIGAEASPVVVTQYARAAHAHDLAFDDEFSSFDRLTLSLGRRARILTRCMDAYCAMFHRYGALRRKLIVLAAILEHVAPTNESFDRGTTRPIALTAVSLFYAGLMFALSLTLGALVLLPAAVVCWIADRSTQRAAHGRPAQ